MRDAAAKASFVAAVARSACAPISNPSTAKIGAHRLVDRIGGQRLVEPAGAVIVWSSAPGPWTKMVLSTCRPRFDALRVCLADANWSTDLPREEQLLGDLIIGYRRGSALLALLKHQPQRLQHLKLLRRVVARVEVADVRSVTGGGANRPSRRRSAPKCGISRRLATSLA